MKRASLLLIIFLVLVSMLVIGCKGREESSAGTIQPAAPANANAAENSQQPTKVESGNSTAASSKDGDAPLEAAGDQPAQLVGVYLATEIQDKGVVTLVTGVQSTFNFHPDGTYSRVAKKQGKTYHSDAGVFRIEAPDKLVLTIELSGQAAQPTIQNPPISKTHKFSLSPDGDELRLTSDKGSVAVFRRVSTPKAP